MSTDLSTAELDRPEISSAVAARFGDRVAVAHRYAALLTHEGIERGMIGPREAERVWERHLLNSATLAEVIARDVSVVDLGSGAGLPGIPLAIARPDLSVALLEPMQRRVNFLELCLAELELPNVTVHRGRAEDGIGMRADVVVVRAVASLEKLVRLSAGLMLDNGILVALKGKAAAAELAVLDPALQRRSQFVRVSAPGEDASIVLVRSSR